MLSLTQIQEYMPILSKCFMFNGIPEEQYLPILHFLSAKIVTYQKNSYLVQLGEPFRYSMLVLEGTLEGSFINENYDKINMNYFDKGTLLGESLACAEIQESPIQLKAVTDSTVMLLDFNVIHHLTNMPDTYQLQVIMNLIHALSHQNIFLNQKVRILSQKSLRDRIVIYLESLKKDDDGYVTVPFSKTALAEFLGVNRSALSREISRMLEEKMILSKNNQFKLNL